MRVQGYTHRNGADEALGKAECVSVNCQGQG